MRTIVAIDEPSIAFDAYVESFAFDDEKTINQTIPDVNKMIDLESITLALS